jgi:hypothetical protein
MKHDIKKHIVIGISLLSVMLLATIFSVFAAKSAPAVGHNIYRVAPEAQGAGDCSSWENACTLQTALAKSVNTDEIWVNMGVYKPGTYLTNTFTIPSGVAVYGGFTGTELFREQRDPQSNLTILSGDIDDNDTNTDGNNIAESWQDIVGNNSIHVVFFWDADIYTELDGFVITAGKAGQSVGTNCCGAGIYLVSSSPSLSNIIVSGNSASKGGAIFGLDGSNPYLVNVLIMGSTATYGGGMYNNNSNPTLVNVVFNGNSAIVGSGLYNFNGSSPTLTNVTFHGNTAYLKGSGVYNDIDSDPILNNVIIWGNTGKNFVNVSSTPTISYSDIKGCGSSGSGWVTDCGTDGGGNIELDPFFTDADGTDDILGNLDDDLRLGVGSPCIDTGDNDAVPVEISTDFDGQPRFIDVPAIPDSGAGIAPIVDMGAYEKLVDIFLPAVFK